jgi:hypothetical protein
MRTNRSGFLVLTALTLPLVCNGIVLAGDVVWNAHEAPYNFRFGNHIDTHQETRLVQDDSDSDEGTNQGDLTGWFYVFDSGDTLEDGTPILEHCTKPEHYDSGCVAGWRIDAKPCIEEVNGCRAMSLYHYHDHPVWLLGARVDDSGGLRGSRQDIVQPGSFTHMYWLTRGLAEFPSSLDVDAERGNSPIEAVFGLNSYKIQCA